MKMKRNVYFLLCPLIFSLLCGCGSAGSQKTSNVNQDTIAYKTQTVSFPEYASFEDACSEGTDICYFASDLDETNQHQSSFYILRQGSTAPEQIFSLPPGQQVQNMTMDSDGNIYYLGYEEVVSEEGEPQTSPALTLYKTDANGTQIFAVDLSGSALNPNQPIIQDLAVDGDKRIVLFSSNQEIYVLNPNGEPLFEDKTMGKIHAICQNQDKVYIGYQDGNGLSIKEVDMPTKKLSAKLDVSIPGASFYMTADGAGRLIIASAESAYVYTPESGELVKKLDWSSYDFTGITAGMILPYEENGILTISRNYATVPMTVDAAAFCEATAEEAASIQEKAIITIGILDTLPAGLKTEIVNFNKSNPEVKIETKNYNEDSNLLYTELIAGTAPDLLMLPSDKLEQFSRKGALEDLNPYFSQDTSLNRADFMENILAAFETDGHLYGIPLNFTVSTVVAKTSDLGDMTSWNIDEFISFVENFPEDVSVFDNSSKSGVFSLLKRAYTPQLVDMTNVEDPLDRDLLIKMLEFSNQYVSDNQYTYDDNLTGKLAEDQVKIMDTPVFMAHDYYARCGLFGEPVTYIGYPTNQGNGNLIRSPYTFTIRSGCANKELAWKFISTLLSEDSQMRMEADYSTMGFHIRKDATEAHLTYCKDNTSSYLVMTASGGFSQYKFTAGDLRDEDIEQIRSLLNSLDTAIIISPEIDQIIDEEASLYFDGTTPLEETVNVIESKIKIYVSELN